MPGKAKAPPSTRNYDLAPGEMTRVCPYDRYHDIRLERIPRHLVKCRVEYEKKHGKQDMLPCCFNSTHIIPKMELEFHQKHCMDAKVVIDSIAQTSEEDGDPGRHGNCATDIRRDVTVEGRDDEDWSCDPPVPAYDPQKKLETKNLYALKRGAQPAERKAYQHERQALRNKLAQDGK